MLRANLWGIQGRLRGGFWGKQMCWKPEPVTCTCPPRDSCLSRPDRLRPLLPWRDSTSSCLQANLASSWNKAVSHLHLSLSKPPLQASWGWWMEVGSIVGLLIPHADTKARAPANACLLHACARDTRRPFLPASPHPRPTPGRSSLDQARRGLTSPPLGPGHTARLGLVGGSLPVACRAARLDTGPALHHRPAHTLS